MKRLLPCPYTAYRKTRWYRRLVAGEFILQFDQAPEREVIIDAIAECMLSTNDLETWKNRIRELCMVNRTTWESYSPGSLLAQLRRERRHYLQGKAIIPWRTSGFHEAINPWDPEESTQSLVIIPDLYDSAPLDVQVQRLRSPWGAQSNYLVCLPASCTSKQQITEETYTIPDAIEIPAKTLQNLAGQGKIVCADIWYAMAFLQEGIDIVACLDRREWFTAVLYQESVFEAPEHHLPSETFFSSILHPVQSPGTIRMFRYMESQKEGYVHCGVERTITMDEPTPPWLTSLQKSQKLSIETGYYIQSESGEWAKTPDLHDGAIHAAMVVMDANLIHLEPMLFEGKASPLAVSYPNGGLFSSFNYYFTENLKAWYASYDPRPIPWKDFILDYYAMRVGETLKESVPLYHKTLLGYSTDGRLFSSDGSWTEITLSIENSIFHFAEDGKDNQTSAQLHRPENPDHIVGEGMWCTTFIHDYVWDVRRGPVMVPPFGVVVTSTHKLCEPGIKAVWKVTWQNFPVSKESIAWISGGLNALVKNRINVVETTEKAYHHLVSEGWYTKASILTQETQLTQHGVQPRTCIGSFKNKIVVVSITGRDHCSKGATFTQEASLAQYLVTKKDPDASLDFLVNLDGGASSVLGCSKDQESYCLLTKPSPSITNPAGQPRCVPSLLSIHFKENHHNET
nr:phosphodiester glycosidase family protein [uncultured Sphaerochaeta sp.]